MKFESINELRKRYEIKASFYKKDDFLFRNYADIIKKDYTDDKIDAYVIMINPGSCKPVHKNIDFTNSTSPENAIYVDVKSDRAQKRVMQFMDNMNYNKVRIFNLFDCRESKSNEAIQMATKNYGFPISIFSEKRRDELNKLTKYDSPYIIAYGVNGLIEYKKKALNFLDSKSTYGVMKDNNSLSYYYLSPLKEKTAQEIISQIVNQLKNS